MLDESINTNYTYTYLTLWTGVNSLGLRQVWLLSIASVISGLYYWTLVGSSSIFREMKMGELKEGKETREEGKLLLRLLLFWLHTGGFIYLFGAVASISDRFNVSCCLKMLLLLLFIFIPAPTMFRHCLSCWQWLAARSLHLIMFCKHNKRVTRSVSSVETVMWFVIYL